MPLCYGLRTRPVRGTGCGRAVLDSLHTPIPSMPPDVLIGPCLHVDTNGWALRRSWTVPSSRPAHLAILGSLRVSARIAQKSRGWRRKERLICGIYCGGFRGQDEVADVAVSDGITHAVCRHYRYLKPSYWLGSWLHPRPSAFTRKPISPNPAYKRLFTNVTELTAAGGGGGSGG